MFGEREELIGRQAELSALARTLEALRRGSGSAVEIVGEFGIGKTRLLRELCDRGDDAGLLVLSGRATEFESQQPLAPFVDAMDEYLGSLEGRLSERLGEDRAGELAAVFPSVTGLDASAGIQQERYRLHYAVRGVLELLAEERPVLLTLDDVHWADEASAELISYLLRRPPDAPVLLALAYRTRRSPQRLESVLQSAARENRALHVELGPLTREDVDVLLGEAVSSDRKQALYEDSGGNPFFLDQLLRSPSPRAPSSGSQEPGSVGDVPSAVVDALSRELERLGARERGLLEGAAVVGEQFHLDLAGEAADLHESEAIAAIDQLVDVGVLQTTEVPRRFRFRHPIVRRAVYESTRVGWRLDAHARVAARLGASGAPLSTQAHHVERCARAGDERAIALLTRAAHAATARAPATAVRWFAAALRLLPEQDPDGQRRVELLLAMAAVLASIGRLMASSAALHEALDLLSPDSAPVHETTLVMCAKIDHQLGRHQEARNRLLQALSMIPDERSPEAITIRVELACDCFFTGDLPRMRTFAREAIAGATLCGEGSATAVAAAVAVAADCISGAAHEPERRMAQAAEGIDRLEDVDLSAHLYSLACFAWCEVILDEFERASRHLDRGLAMARATGQGYLIGLLTFGRAAAAVGTGRLSAGMEWAEEAIEMSLLAENGVFLAGALGLRCWAATLAGPLSDAIAFGEQAVEAAGDQNDSFSGLARCYIGEAWLEAGEPARCREALLRAGGGPELPAIEPIFRARWFEVLVRAELAIGGVEAADAWAARAEAIAAALPVPGRLAEALRARAAVLFAQGDPAGAGAAALAAAEHAHTSGAQITEARCRMVAGAAFVACGEQQRGVLELEHAERDLSACGAMHLRDHAAHELRQLGRRVARSGRRRGEDGLEALTTRQLEIAELVCEGKTNRQIANALFLSEKTIETHMGNIFTELGVRSRAGLATLVERERGHLPGSAVPAS